MMSRSIVLRVIDIHTFIVIYSGSHCGGVLHRRPTSSSSSSGWFLFSGWLNDDEQKNPSSITLTQGLFSVISKSKCRLGDLGVLGCLWYHCYILWCLGSIPKPLKYQSITTIPRWWVDLFYWEIEVYIPSLLFIVVAIVTTSCSENPPPPAPRCPCVWRGD
jgi:hypothetical protein